MKWHNTLILKENIVFMITSNSRITKAAYDIEFEFHSDLKNWKAFIHG